MEKLNEIEGALNIVREIAPELKRAEEEVSAARSRQTTQTNKLSNAVKELAKAIAAGVKQLPREHRQTFENELTIQLKSN